MNEEIWLNGLEVIAAKIRELKEKGINPKILYITSAALIILKKQNQSLPQCKTVYELEIFELRPDSQAILNDEVFVDIWDLIEGKTLSDKLERLKT